MLTTTDLYYFSPTGGTKRSGEIFCEGIAKKVRTVDLGTRGSTLRQPESELTVVAVPVFGGRIPTVAAEKLKELNGHGKKAVTFVVYGNRAYEDALLEVNDCMEACGFQVIASAALVAQHSMAPKVAQGRPDEQDKASILGFAGQVLNKLQSGAESIGKVPGNRPYKEGMSMPAAPVCLPSCVQCGTCVSVCPTEAVHMEQDAVISDPKTCILCMTCVAACPAHARILPPPLQEKLEQMLGALQSVRRENAYFL